MTVPSVYTLTTITGRRRNEGRETFVLSFEMRRKTLLCSLLGLVPSAFVGMIASLVIGQYGLFVAAAVQAVWSYLVLRRTRDGLQMATWRALLDKRASRNLVGKFVQCGQIVLTGSPTQVQVLASMQDVADTRSSDVEDFLTTAHATSDAPRLGSAGPITTRPDRKAAHRPLLDADLFNAH